MNSKEQKERFRKLVLIRNAAYPFGWSNASMHFPFEDLKQYGWV
jgi:hypothetical protein